MRACRRDTLRSVRRMVLPSLRPIVISSRIRGTTVVLPSSSWMMSLNMFWRLGPRRERPNSACSKATLRALPGARQVGYRFDTASSIGLGPRGAPAPAYMRLAPPGAPGSRAALMGAVAGFGWESAAARDRPGGAADLSVGVIGVACRQRVL